MNRYTLLLMSSAIAALLLCACKERADSSPRAVASGPGSHSVFEGTWKNDDEKTGSITRAEIRPRGSGFEVSMWGRCHPTDCDWGKPHSYDFSSMAGGPMKLEWRPGFAVKKQELTLLPEGRMEVVTRTHFTDRSGRKDYEIRDFLRKLPPSGK